MTPILVILFSLLLSSCHIKFNNNENEQDIFKTQLDLKGEWKFSIGDDLKWKEPGFVDDNWENIKVPSPWENEGFNGYDGYAWYRKQFKMPENLKGKTIYFSLGTIDDCDEFYVNGHLVGLSGSFPPNYHSEYNSLRMYPCPQEYINFNGNNLIAVRVYDDELAGGITSGDIAVKTIEAFQTDISLEGKWNFITGDSSVYKDINCPDKNWEKIFVPGYWEPQGHNDYDGFAWYRKSFTLTDNLKNKKLVFIGGKIDDLDQVYINGVMIGSTGDMGRDLGNSFSTKPSFDQEWKKFRAYYIPDSLLNQNKPNIIAVRVYDGFLNGGMYQGPVGLITRDKYTKFWRDLRSK
jgi:sialate O-acetylesterase